MPSPPVTFFDTHLHVDSAEEAGLVFETARRRGVRLFLLAATDRQNAEVLHAVATAHAGVFSTVGIHPHEARHFDGDREPFRRLCRQPKVVAVGEIGLDYHYEHSPRETQKDVFRVFLRLAVEHRLPVVIHCREAFADCWTIVDHELPPEHPFEMHSFTGTVAETQRITARGGFVSVNGIVTFGRAENVRAILDAVPPDRLLLETDAPWLAPKPHRGKPNQPAYLPHIAAFVAEHLNVPVEQLAQQTTNNACRFFNIDAQSALA